MKRISWIIALVILVGCSPAAGTTVPSSATGAQTTPVTAAAAITVPATIPAAADLTAEEVVLGLKEAGVAVDQIVTYTEETDTNNLLGRPNQYTSKSNFSLKTDEVFAGEDPDNTIEVFETEADATARKEYIEEVIKGVAFAQQYLYQSGKYLLRIDNQTTPTKAREIEQLFYDLVKQLTP